MIAALSNDSAARRNEILARYGSLQAALEDTMQEAALRNAARDLTLASVPEGSAEYRIAAAEAFPLPRTVAGAWSEHLGWLARWDDLEAVIPGCDPGHLARTRDHILEELLDSLPATSLEDLLARIAWLRETVEREFDCMEEQLARLDRLQQDIQAWAASASLATDIVRHDESAPVIEGQPGRAP
jgi:hypothetical protein